MRAIRFCICAVISCALWLIPGHALAAGSEAWAFGFVRMEGTAVWGAESQKEPQSLGAAQEEAQASPVLADAAQASVGTAGELGY